MRQADNTKLWPTKTAVVLSDESNLFLIIRGLLRSLDWNLDVTTDKVSGVMTEITNMRSTCMIVVDTPTYPAYEHLRIILRDPVARLTPVMVLVSETQRQDIAIYEKVIKAQVGTKPLTPNNFLPAFKSLIQSWQTPAMMGLRKVGYSLNTLQEDNAITLLRKLATDAGAKLIALEAEISLLLKKGRHREAEDRLLELFKSMPNNANIITQLAWFYMKCHMPDQALRYLEKLKSAAPFSTIFDLDIASCHIAAGRTADAITYLRAWHEAHPGNDFSETQLAKMMVSQGMINTTDTGNVSRQLLRKTEDLWDEIEHKSKPIAPHSGNQSAS
jgi:predicted Zn-dependent protease